MSSPFHNILHTSVVTFPFLKLSSTLTLTVEIVLSNITKTKHLYIMTLSIFPFAVPTIITKMRTLI